MDLIFWFFVLIGVFIGGFIINLSEKEYKKDDGLTDTQRNFRKQMKKAQNEFIDKSINSYQKFDDPLFNEKNEHEKLKNEILQEYEKTINRLNKEEKELYLKIKNERKKYISKKQYISLNIRPFKISEWLLWGVERRFIKKYLLSMIGFIIGGLVIPYIFSLPINLSFFLIISIFLDMRLYNSKRLLEITEWNPDFQKRYGKD